MLLPLFDIKLQQHIFFPNLQGGVHLTKEPSKVPNLVTSMLGNRLITKQTPPEGIPVSKVMVAEAIDITRETYFCILLDRESNGPVIVASVSKSTKTGIGLGTLHLNYLS